MLSFWGDKTDDRTWNDLFLGGVIWPGVASITIEKSRDIDQAKAKGKDGITLTDNGFNAAKVNITLRVSQLYEWLALQVMLPRFDPKISGGVKTPVDIVHPATSLAGIKYVYIQKVSYGNPEGGILTINIECIEWFASTKATSSKPKPKGLNGTDSTGGPLEGFDVAPTKPSAGGGNF